jgi:ABC-2 type transport system permease protein
MTSVQTSVQTSVPTTLSTAIADDTRRVPKMGGFNFTAISLEIRRVLRNRRTLMFIVLFPNIFFYLFGILNGAARGGPAMLGLVMLNMAVYGAMVGTTSGGAAVSLERSQGWSRQLRLTPMSPYAYIVMKVMVSMTLGAMAIVSTYVVGALNGVHYSPSEWILCGLASWLASFVFAAFGLFMGFLLPSENVMQFVGPLLAVMAMFGGIFIPLQALPKTLQEIAKFTPMYGVGQLARAPITGEITAWAIGGVTVWTILFGIGAVVLFRRDTTRV